MKTERVSGFVELIRPHEVGGWVFRPDRPSDHLTVEILCADQQIASAIASSFREDLRRAGIGKGDHAFSIKLPTALSAKALLSIRVMAILSDGTRALVPALPTALSPAILSAADVGDVPADGALLIDPAFGQGPGRSGPARPCQTQLVAKYLAESSRSLAEVALNVIDEQQRPVFVLGSARSGTTAVSSALLKTSYYQGFGEGHIMPLARALFLTCSGYYKDSSNALQNGTHLRHIPQTVFEMSIRSMFINVARSTFSKPHWVDKTPSAAMVYSAPLLREMWPNARFIFLRRRAVENVVSRLRKFPETLLRNHCSDWAAVMEGWLKVREELADVSIEVEHLNLAHQPAVIGEQVGDFLGLPADVRDKFIDALISDRPEQTSEAPTRVYKLEELGWTREDLERLRTICGPMMEAYGYSFDHAPVHD